MSAPRPFVGAIIVAAGGSSRMQGADKLFVRLAGRPLLAHVLARFQEAREVDKIVLVVSSANLQRARGLVAEYGIDKVAAVCEGGTRRQDSVRLGLSALGRLGESEWVLVHDGARILVDPCITEGLEAARETGAAVPAVPITDTVKETDPEGTVLRTLDRGRLRAAQTPQVFRHDLLLRAHEEVSADPSTALRAGFTDDAAMLEALGLPVKLYPGSPLNIKITTPEDLRTAEALLQEAASR